MNLAVKLTLTLLLGFFFYAPVQATHIVGGEFELVHIQGSEYELRLIVYFDKVNGDPAIIEGPAAELLAVASIYRKSDNEFLRSVNLLLRSSESVPYTNIDCTIDELETLRLLYTSRITLDPQLFNDQEGYYISWQRCCRNNTIDNIQLPVPNSVGQTFYLEFPPVVDAQGNPFINSSPVLFPPLSDYACVGEKYYVDFSGDDADGDSIAYSMVDPLNSSTTDAIPPRSPAPYPLVPWEAGIDVDNQVPGNPSINISANGLLTVTPSTAGLFVFAVRAEEYRFGKKIGEVRRDFQMLVIDCPDPGSPPKLFARRQNGELISDGQIIKIEKGEDRCLELLITDPDAPEILGVLARPVNFNANLSNLFTSNFGVIENPNDTLRAEICFPECPIDSKSPMYIDLIAIDDACSLPLADTIRIGVIIDPPDENQEPQFIQPLEEKLTATVKEGDNFYLPVIATDPDNEELNFNVFPKGFSMQQYGMRFNTILSDNGRIQGELIWEPDCQIHSFSDRNYLEVLIVADDLDYCNVSGGDSLTVRLNIELPPNNEPEVTSSLPVNTVFVDLGETIQFDVMVDDLDNEQVSLHMSGDGFNPESLGVSFADVTGQGHAKGSYSWFVDCDKVNPEVRNNYTFLFIGNDSDYCKLSNFDTLQVHVILRDPENEVPEIGLADVVNEPFIFSVDEMVSLTIEGYDADNDQITLELLHREMYNSFNYNFEDVIGTGKVSSVFTWIPDCRQLSVFVDENDIRTGEPEFIKFQFLVRDNYCVREQQDTMTVEIAVEDFYVDDSDFIPPNVFTPNGDNYNASFTIPNLPADNCINQFEEIRIYNRLGKLVFNSKNREFEWFGGDSSTGVYYYWLKYSQKEYNGTVHIIH